MHQPAGYGKDGKGDNTGEAWHSLASAHHTVCSYLLLWH